MTDNAVAEQPSVTQPLRPSKWKRWLRGLLLIYLGYVGLMYFAQRKLLFPGQYLRSPEVLKLGRGMEQLWIELDEAKVEVLLLSSLKEPENGASHQHPAIIYTHGNGELIDDWLNELKPYREAGCYVVLVEFPGYGRSTGKPSEASLTEVVTRVYDHLLTRPEIDSTKIVAHGRSMGGGAACLLAARRPVAALILESTFTSIRAMAGRMGLPGFMCSDPFDNLQVVTDWKKPLLILHGTCDRVIPYAHGKALAASNPAAEFITWQNVDHNDYPAPINRSWPEVRVFLEKAGIL